MNPPFILVGRWYSLLIWIAIMTCNFTPHGPLLAQQPFICDTTFYLSSVSGSNTDLDALGFSTDPITITSIETYSNLSLNGAGFRPQNGYVYGIISGSNQLVRLGQNGVYQNLGAVTGLQFPFWNSLTYSAGDVLSNGNLFVHRTSRSRFMYEIDVTVTPPQMVQRHELNRSIQLQDFAYSPSDDKLYGVGNDGRKYMIDPTNWTVTAVGTDAPATAYGAAFVNHRDEVFVYRNDNGGLYKVDYGPNGTGSGVMTLVSTGPLSNSIDGVSCAAYFEEPPCRLAVMNPHIMQFKPM